jgi:hypothetical protein
VYTFYTHQDTHTPPRKKQEEEKKWAVSVTVSGVSNVREQQMRDERWALRCADVVETAAAAGGRRRQVVVFIINSGVAPTIYYITIYTIYIYIYYVHYVTQFTKTKRTK